MTVATETRTDSDGDKYTANVLQGVDTAGIPYPIPLEQDVPTVAEQLNGFIAAPSPQTLTIAQGNQLFMLAWVAGVAAIAGMPTLMMMRFSGVPRLEIDKTQRRLRLQRVYKRRSPKLLKEVALDQITAVEVVEGKDNDGDPYYTTVVKTKQAETVELEGRSQREAMDEMAKTIQTFLGISGQPKPSSEIADSPTNSSHAIAEPAAIVPNEQPGQVIYETNTGITYNQFDRAIVWGEKLQALITLEGELSRLKFVPLGSFTSSRFAGIVIHAYTHPALPINAIIVQTNSMKSMVDLYSTFRDGASLTTSTMPGVSDIPAAKIFRNNYPTASLPTLLSYHRDRLAQLNGEHGGKKAACTTLEQLAIAMEDYFQRQPSGLSHVFQTYLRQLGIVLFNRKAITGR